MSYCLDTPKKSGRQRKTCKCGHNKMNHAIRSSNTTWEYRACGQCDCKYFRPKAKGEL